jgi:hypothetical protein
MTKISYVAGIAPNEFKDRGANVPKTKAFIPYTSMTKGETNLSFELEKARILSNFYPDVPYYRNAATMIENALYGGISGGVSFVGNVPDDLQRVANYIVLQSRAKEPASKGGILFRENRGIYIGDPIVKNVFRDIDCKDYVVAKWADRYQKYWDDLPLVKKALFPNPKLIPKAGQHKVFFNHPYKELREKYQAEYLKCVFQKDVEIVLNDRLEGSSMHMLYHRMASNFEPAIGTLAITKRLLHRAAVSDLGNLSQVGSDVMGNWVELGVLRNAVSNGLAPYNSQVYSAYLSPDPEKWAEQTKKTRGGAAQIGEPVTLAAITALVVAIGAAITAGAKLQESFNAKKINALQNSQGFGTDAFSPEKNDYLKAKGDTTLPIPSESDNTLLLVGGLAALYYFTKD